MCESFERTLLKSKIHCLQLRINRTEEELVSVCRILESNSSQVYGSELRGLAQLKQKFEQCLVTWKRELDALEQEQARVLSTETTRNACQLAVRSLFLLEVKNVGSVIRKRAPGLSLCNHCGLHYVSISKK